VSPMGGECAACHKPRERTDAFHTQCMGCHEEFGAGPTQDACNQCHGY
jgi:hypothetical protein